MEGDNELVTGGVVGSVVLGINEMLGDNVVGGEGSVDTLGGNDGREEGCDVGATDGSDEGCEDGVEEGCDVGATDGSDEGCEDGVEEG